MGLLLPLLLLLQEADGVYTDEILGISTPLPRGWSVTRSPDKSKAVVMRAPAEAKSGATFILVVAEAMPDVASGRVTLDAFLEAVQKQYPSKFKDYEFVKAEKGKDGENLTLDLYYRYTSSGQKIGQLQRLVWTRTNHYSLTWGCLADAFEANRASFEKWAKAFKVVPRK
jgi:hypothetical protein